MAGKHTPTPWRVETSPVRRSLCILSTDAWICGELSNGNGEDEGEGEANAEFIVKACNAHYDLVAMLTEAAIQIEYMQEKFVKTGTGEAVASRCRALLAKLEAK